MHADRQGTVVLAGRAQRRLETIVDDLMDRQRREVPEFFVTDDPAFHSAVRASTHVNTDLMLGALRRPGALPSFLPAGARLEADAAALHGAPVEALLRTYRLAQQALVEHLIDDVDHEGADGVPRIGDTLRATTRALFAYMETVMPLVASEYGAERARLQADPDLGRLRRVEAALAGDDSVDLGYPLRGPHVALASGADRQEAVAAVAHALEVPSLAVTAPDGRLLAWLATNAVDEVRERLQAEGISGPAGLGGPATGPHGFRAAHHQARLAQRVATGRGERIVDVRSSAIEALALGGQRAAWEIAHAELGPLAGTDPASIRLRTTLEAWFAAREHLSEAATALGVAPRTVSYRLRRTEELLGSTIAGRRAELEAALRLVRLFGGAPPPPGP